MASENKAARDVVETVESMLKEWGDGYERFGKQGTVDFVLKDHIVITASPGTGIVKVRTRLEVSPDLLTKKRGRLLEACNVINKVYFLKATVDAEGVRFSYEIPAGGITNGLKYVVANVLHFYRTEIDRELFRLALETDDDLDRYFDEKMEREVAELRKSRQ